MPKCLSLCLTALLLSLISSAQLSQGNWLIGGNASFSSSKYSNDATASYSQSNIKLAPTIGYFLIDKFAAGLRPAFTYTRTLINESKGQTNQLSLEPFVRYYFLNPENRANIFSEVGFQYLLINQTGNPQATAHGFSIAAGPVIYLNTSVGVEFMIGYSTTKYHGVNNDKNNTLQVGLGIQFHLERDN